MKCYDNISSTLWLLSLSLSLSHLSLSLISLSLISLSLSLISLSSLSFCLPSFCPSLSFSRSLLLHLSIPSRFDCLVNQALRYDNQSELWAILVSQTLRCGLRPTIECVAAWRCKENSISTTTEWIRRPAPTIWGSIGWIVGCSWLLLCMAIFLIDSTPRAAAAA